MSGLLSSPILLLACLAVGSCAAVPVGARGAGSDTIPAPAGQVSADSSPATDPARNLAAFLALTPAERAQRVKQSEPWLERWHSFATNARLTQAVQEAAIVGAKIPENGAIPRKGLGTGAYEATEWLARATALDPGNAEAWLALGQLQAEMGARWQARDAFAAADRALRAVPLPDGEKGREIRLDVVRNEAWLDRDEARWAEGLARVGEGLALAPRDLELTLVKGLLLADSGRFQEACAIARDLPAIEYRVFDRDLMGLSTARSDYGSRWIEAMAYLAIGETRLADYALGSLHPERRHTPYMRHYWNDVALVCELNDRPEDAGLYYGIALVASPYHEYYPWRGFSAPPRILGQPDARLPVYVFPNQYYLAGSPFAYGAQLAAEAGTAANTTLARARGAVADSALSFCVRRNIRRTCARALRGELRAILHEDALARSDLGQAHDELTRQGLRDARTSTVLGLLTMQAKEYPRALELLREAVAADSASASAWRTLGVALAEMERPAEARVAMGRAIALAPKSAIGWYNRGLLALSSRQWDLAVADLRTAAGLEPSNAEIARALGRAERQLPDTVVTRTVVTRSDTTLIPVLAPAERLELRAAAVNAGSEKLPRDRIGRQLVAIADSDSAARRALRDLETEFQRAPTRELREQLAAGYLRTGEPEKVLQILVPSWGRDLTPLEIRSVLEADRARGDDGRARALAQAVDLARPQPADRDIWALIAVMCSGRGHAREAQRAIDAALVLDPGNAGLRMFRQNLAARAGR